MTHAWLLYGYGAFEGIQTPVAQGRSTHSDDQVDSDQQVVNKDLSIFAGKEAAACAGASAPPAQHSYPTESVWQVILKKSIPAEIRQLILYHY